MQRKQEDAKESMVIHNYPAAIIFRMMIQMLPTTEIYEETKENIQKGG